MWALVVFFIVEVVAVGTANLHYFSDDFTLFHNGSRFLIL